MRKGTRRLRKNVVRGPSVAKNAKAIRALKSKHTLDELKWLEQTTNDAVVSATGTVQPQIFLVPQGINNGQRIGDKLGIVKIEMRFILDLPATVLVANTSDVIRVVIIQDRQANLALPNVLDILFLTDIQSHQNRVNQKRFRFLYDVTKSLSSIAGAYNGTTTQFANRSFGWNKNLTVKIPIEYDADIATTGAVTTITQNNIVALFISESGRLGLQMEFRILYTDN